MYIKKITHVLRVESSDGGAAHLLLLSKETREMGNRVGHNTGGKLAHTGSTVTAKHDISDG